MFLQGRFRLLEAQARTYNMQFRLSPGLLFAPTNAAVVPHVDGFCVHTFHTLRRQWCFLGVPREEGGREERYAAMVTKDGRLCVFGTRGGVSCTSRGVHRWVTTHALESGTQ